MTTFQCGELVNTSEKRNCCTFRYRWLLSTIFVMGYTVERCIRYCWGIVIVAMVKTAPIEHTDVQNNTEGCVIKYFGNETRTTILNQPHGEFDWTFKEQSYILGSYSYGFIVSNILSGRMIEVIGVKWTFGAGLGISSLISMLSPSLAMWRYEAVIGGRILDGFVQGFVNSCISIFLVRWIPKKEQNFIFGILETGASIGMVIAFAATGYLCTLSDIGGWRSVFYIYGSVGVLITFMWLILSKEYPKDLQWISNEERQYIFQDKEIEEHIKTSSLPWKSIILSLPVWACIVAIFFKNMCTNLIHEEQPTFLKSTFHDTIDKNGLTSAMPSVAFAAIICVSGWICDWISSKNIMSDTILRKILVVLGSLLSAVFMCGATFAGCNRLAVVSFMTLSGGILALVLIGALMSIVNMAPQFSGTVTGLTMGIGEIPGFLMPLIISLIIDNQQTLQKWHIVFYITSGLCAIPGIVFLFFGTSELQPWAKPEKSENNNEK